MMGRMAVIALVFSLARAGEPPPQPTPMAADLPRRILVEEERQRQADRRMGAVLDEFRDLVADLRSNGLLEEGRAPEVLGLAGALRSTRDPHVLAAAGHLRTARSTEGRMPALRSADLEIDAVLRGLKDLLRQAKALDAADLLRREVRFLIEEEERIAARTRELGKRLFEGGTVDAAALEELALSQNLLAGRAGRLRGPLGEAAGDAADADEKGRLERAGRAFEELAVEGRLQAAAARVEAKELVGAALEEMGAIEALREIEMILDPAAGSRLLRDAREELRAILEGQKDLRELTERAGDEELKTGGPQLASREDKLSAQLAGVDPKVLDRRPPPDAPGADAPGAEAPPPETAANPIAGAGTAMAEAREALAARKRTDAVGSQKRAEAELARAIAELDRRLADRPGPSLASELADLQATLDAIRDLEEAQRKLRDETSGAGGRGEPVSPLAPSQEALGARTSAAAGGAPLAGIAEALREASGAMDRAAGEMKGDRAAPAVTGQNAALEALTRARQAAESVLAGLDALAGAPLPATMDSAAALLGEQMALRDATAPSEADLGKLSSPQSALAARAAGFPRAASAMRGAAGSLSAGNQGAALAAQDAAIAALQAAAGMGAGQGMGQGMGQGLGQGMGQGQGQGQGIGVSSRANGVAGNMPGIDPRGGDRAFGKSAPAVAPVERDRSAWSSLGSRKVPPPSESFIRELPVEHREMLRAYFEMLSRGSGR